MTVTRLSGPGIAEVVTGYLGDQEDDLIFKRPVLQRLFSGAVAVPCLNWEQRPDKVKENVTASFRRLSEFTERPYFWATFGKEKYELCRIDEALLLKSIILQAYPGQKEFWFVDIGAGDFQCGSSLVKFLNSQTDLPKDILVNIVGLRGESFVGDRELNVGICKEIRLGGFKIEDIAKEFERCKLPKNATDLAVCSITMVHLKDKPGTFAQIHDLLRPGTGLFVTDGFTFHLDKKGYKPSHHDQDLDCYILMQLLLDTGSPFLTARFQIAHRRMVAGLLLRRSGSDPCCLPLRYLPSEDGDPKFAWEPAFQNPWKIESIPERGIYLYGSKSLFVWLKTNQFIHEHQEWMPIQPLPLDPKALL